jgi:isochorismate hydrolase
MERRQFLQSSAISTTAAIFGAYPMAAAETHPSFLQEHSMSETTRPYDPLTSENAALILVDHQVGLMTGVRDYSTGELKHNVVALAKAAKALKLPIIVTTTARDSMWGPTFPELVEALPGVPIIDRSSVNAFDDPKVAQAIIATGRKKLIFAGISLEVCAAFPAITAIVGALMPMSQSIRPEPSARPSAKLAFCACSRPA